MSFWLQSFSLFFLMSRLFFAFLALFAFFGFRRSRLGKALGMLVLTDERLRSLGWLANLAKYIVALLSTSFLAGLAEVHVAVDGALVADALDLLSGAASARHMHVNCLTLSISEFPHERLDKASKLLLKEFIDLLSDSVLDILAELFFFLFFVGFLFSFSVNLT